MAGGSPEGVTESYDAGMRPSRFPTLFVFLLSAIALAFQAPGPGTLLADDPPKKEGDKPGDPAKPGDPPKDGEDDPDDFFEGETSFTKEQVDKAVTKGVTWLKKRQDGDGSWGVLGGGNKAYGGGAMQGKGYEHPAGPTSLALYTLLKCKCSPKDPVVLKGFRWLQDKNHDKPDGSYEVSMLLLAVCATADQSKTTKASEKNAAKMTLSGAMRGWAQTLVNLLIDKHEKRGWRYQVKGAPPTPGGPEDISSTQLASLALFSAHRLGIKVKSNIWEDILSFSLDQQEDSGPEVEYEDPVTKKPSKWQARGFSYLKEMSDPDFNHPVGSMTACGVGNLMMSRFILTDGGKKRADWDKRPDAEKVQKAVNDGLAWLIANWSPFDNPKKGNVDVYHMYWLYSFERMMDLIEMQRVGKHMWYSEMGQQILDKQAENGHWDTGTTHEPQDVLDTCFALLFLKRATRGAIPFPSLTGGSEDAPVDGR